MKYILALAFLVISSSRLAAQQETPKQLQETAKALLQQGQYDKAVLSLDRAHQLEPGNNEITKDLAFANYLKRDFARAIELGKELVEKPGADQQDFQILGLSYKAIASYKECAKLYKTALKKFPNSGVIYNEYGELLALDNNIDATIEQWEKGIELDPGYSSNYYNAALYYTRSKNWLRAALYSELFLNLESFSARTDEIKKQLPDIYQGLFTPGALQAVRTTNEFEKAVIASLTKAAAGVQDISPDNVARIRTRFIQDWVQDKQKRYPFQLFDNQQYLLDQGLFEAYNYWLFSATTNTEGYAAWANSHPKESEAFKTLQQNKVFKIPAGQYYFGR